VRAGGLGASAAGLAGAAALVACCGLGPATVVGGLASALAGVGLGSWLATAAGLALLALGGGLVRRRRRRAAACRSPAAGTRHGLPADAGS
jgi:hypothetical protein